MRTVIALLVCLLLIASAAPTPALEAGPDDVHIRVVDVGPGLCVVAKIPGGHHLIFDAARRRDRSDEHYVWLMGGHRDGAS